MKWPFPCHRQERGTGILLRPHYIVSQPLSAQQIVDEDAYKLTQVIEFIKNNYVDSAQTNELIETAIREMLKKLDPHSVYITAKEVQENNEPLKGAFEGVGITYNILNDTILVISTTEKGPAEKVGIMSGDRIVEIDGENVAGIGISSDSVKAKLKGRRGTKVQVAVRRRNIDNNLYFQIVRGRIPIYSIVAAYMVTDDVGYIKLNRFSADSKSEFLAACDELKRKGMRHLVFDLQDNGGGYLSTAEMLADEFLDNDKLIVYSEGRNYPKEERQAFQLGVLETGRVVVLIDEGSASASEIFAGAIQDWDRGIIAGRRSYGKGLVQRSYTLRDGALIRLTVARYYTPTGRSIQKPYDIGNDAYRDDLKERLANGELTNKDSVKFDKTQKYTTKLNKRTVYGGGGIMPDIFVPLDTNKVSTFHRMALTKGYLNKFTLIYADTKRDSIKTKYYYFDDFNRGFDADQNMLNSFFDFVLAEQKAAGTTYTNEQTDSLRNEMNTTADLIKIQIKALVARDLWRSSEYFQVINQTNDIFNKAIEIIIDKRAYNAILKGKDD